MKKKGTPPLFLYKVYEMLEDVSISEIISWHQDGSEFIIYSINDFSEKVLPIYFSHSNFPSFIRQLNIYDFHKLRSSHSEHIYTHPLFIKDRPDLLKEIHRKTPELPWPVSQTPGPSTSEMVPLINKLYQIHKTNVGYAGQISSLEERAGHLTSQNKELADKLWENREIIKKIEKALMFLARFYKHNEKAEEFSMVFPMFDNKLSITEVPMERPRKRSKVMEEGMESPLHFSEFEEEVGWIDTNRYEEKLNISEFSEFCEEGSLEIDKLDFLVNH